MKETLIISIMIYYLIWILIALLYAPVIFELYRSRWIASDYTHAYFVLPVFFFLLWRKWTLLKTLVLKARLDNNVLGIFIFLFGIYIYVTGWRHNYIFLTTLSLIPVLYGLISYLYGSEVIKTLSFPVFYLLLLAPLPVGIIDGITLPMRYGTSIATDSILRFFEYPIIREGLLLSINDVDLFMGQPCSGFRSLITMLSLSIVYVYISKISLPNKFLLVSSVLPLSLLGNLMRVIILCLITYYFGEAAGQGFFHTLSGILIFIMVILELAGLEYILGKLCMKTVIT